MNGFACGEGIYTKGGEVWKGTFHGNLRHGYCECTYVDGGINIGEY